EDVMRFDVKLRIVDARRKVLERGEYHRAALVLEQTAVCGRALENGALRRKIAEQRDKPAFRLERRHARGDDAAIDPSAIVKRQPLAQGFARHRQTVEM